MKRLEPTESNVLVLILNLNSQEAGELTGGSIRSAERKGLGKAHTGSRAACCQTAKGTLGYWLLARSQVIGGGWPSAVTR